MKPIFFFLTLCLTLIVISGCKKDKSESLDYRQSYVGTWEMTIISDQVVYSTDMGGNVTTYYSDTTVKTNVKITIDESSEDGIVIDLNPNSINSYENKVTLSENGQFSKCCSPTVSCEITGSFASINEITMEMANWGHCNGYSAGGTSHQTVTGIKL